MMTDEKTSATAMNDWRRRLSNLREKGMGCSRRIGDISRYPA
jgi:hypothetical protein